MIKHDPRGARAMKSGLPATVSEEEKEHRRWGTQLRKELRTHKSVLLPSPKKKPLILNNAKVRRSLVIMITVCIPRAMPLHGGLSRAILCAVHVRQGFVLFVKYVGHCTRAYSVVVFLSDRFMVLLSVCS